MISEDGFILKEFSIFKPVKIPEGSVRCPSCEGSGKTLVAYRDPGPNEYWSCILCLGKGYEKIETLEKLGWQLESGKWIQKRNSQQGIEKK